MSLKLTASEIEDGRSPKGGFTRAQLAQWGVPWPPPKGWRDALMAGEPITEPGGLAGVRLGMDPHELLRKVVSAVVQRGHASDLYEFPDVLAYFGARLPEPAE